MVDEAQPPHTNPECPAAEATDVGRIAQAAASTWRDIDAALSPIISQRGVAALFKRSLHLTRARHPALAAVNEDEIVAGSYGALLPALSQQTSESAAAANDALLQTFCDLLSNLIGTSLSEQLLRSVRQTTSSGDAAQDTTQ